MFSKKAELIFGTAALAVLAAVVFAWPSLGPADRTWAIFGAAGAQLVVAIGFLAVKAAAVPANRRLAQLAEVVDRAFGRLLSRYGVSYRQWVLDSRRYVETKGLATVGDFTPELEEVFVDVDLTPRPAHQVGTGVLADAPVDAVQRHSIWDFLDRTSPVVLAIIGTPGSGKTTLLSQVARELAGNPKAHVRSVPVLLYLRDQAPRIVADPGIGLPDLLRKAVPVLRTAEPSGWWEVQLARGRCVVLLDGLDEVASVDERQETTAWINRQVSIYPSVDYVVTSRPRGYRGAPIESARTLQMRPFTADQVAKFLKGWYFAVECRATGRNDRDVETRAQEGANDLLERLAATPALYDLTVNPLLLTMIANVHRYRGSLPGSRADLYGEVCQVMLWRRHEAKRLALDIPGASKERLLARIAYRMMRKRMLYLPYQQVVATIKEPLTRMLSTVTPEQFLADVSTNGLLVEYEARLYAFAHLTFQEYLAAKHIREYPQLASVLVDAVDDAWWRETTLLYVAGADADHITRGALAAGTPNALSLAFECTEVGAELAPDLREQLQQVLALAFGKGSSAEHRHLAAGVLANRHLRYLVPTPSGSLCPRPITNQLYWLFLKETGHPYPDAPCVADSTEPARGLWASDAAAFVAWLNAIAVENGEAVRRLPTRQELGTLADEPGPAAKIINSQVRVAWTKPHGPDPPQVWTVAGQWAPNTVSTTDVLNAMADDVRRSSILVALLPYAAHAIGFALAHNGERTLDRAITLNGMLTQARSLQIDLVSARGMRRARNLVHEINQALARDKELVEALDRLFKLGLTFDRGTLAGIEQALGRYHDKEIARYLGHVLGLDRDIAIAMEWHQDLGLGDTFTGLHALEKALKDARARLNGVVNPNVYRSAIPTSPLPLGWLTAADAHTELGLTEAWSRVLGRACERALTTMLNRTDTEAHSTAESSFILGFAAATRLTVERRMTVALDQLNASMSVATSAFTAGGALESRWASVVAAELARTAEAVFARRIPLDRAKARQIRLLALALAAEADHREQTETGAHLRSLAAGVTLVQRRVTRPHDLETLLLARA